MELIHYNFFTIGSIIATIFCFYIARLLLTIPDRSSASNHLGLGIFFLGMFHFFYLFAFSINHPIAVFFRWGAILFPMLAALEVGRFFINFKESNAKKKDRRFAYILYSIASLVLIYFIVTSIFATRIYYAQSHYFDFKLPQFYKIFSIIVFAYILIFILIGIFTYRRVSKEDKFTVIAILLSFVIITIIPGVLNALSRDGAVSRSTYQAWTDLLVVIGLFFVVIIYINNTDDKTTILSRITGISMATLMLVLQGIAFIAISNQENSYDRQKIQEARLATSSKQYSEEIRFITSYDIASSQFTNIYAKTQELPNAIEYKPEFLNSWIWFRISQINSNDSTTFRNSLDSILKNTHIEFAGYKALIDDYLKDNTGDQEKLNAKAMIQYFSGLERKIYYNRNKLTALDETGRAEWIEKKKEGEDWLGVFTRGLVAGDLGADRIVLGFLPFQSNSNRNYRGRLEFQKEEVTPEYFTSYFLFDETQSKVYEVGFSYSAYQKFIDEIGRIFTWIVVLTTLLIGFGYRYFFSGALIRPLGNVIEGLKQVNAGNLNVQLPIAVEDEIGFMARSFNSMVESISIGKKKLQEYAEQLEVKVEERTSELKHTLTEVQSLKSQQDGDYFLTSLLIKPLSSNHVDMENV